MKLTVLALSTVLLFGTGALAQDNPPANNGSSMSSTQPAAPNDGAMQNNPSAGSMNNGQPMGYGHRHNHGNWGWLGLFGLLGLFGMGDRRNRNIVAPTATTLPR